MSINLSIPKRESPLKPRIAVVGVGGAGGNAVNNMIHGQLEGVDFIAANTDAQALAQSAAGRHLQLGTVLTQGLGAGSRPEIGAGAAEEVLGEITACIEGANMVFVTAGMGGGTGTGAAPIIARAARELGALTVGVVTKPFHFEGAKRMRIAEEGMAELQQYVDTLIIIPNQNLFRVANERTTFADAFKMADDVLYSGVRGVTDLMVMPGLINLDFADVRTVMTEMGKAMMGTGEAEGDNRAVDAAEAAISNPLLDDVSMKGARGVLINISGGPDMTLFEVDEAANRIRDEVDPDASIIFGSTFDAKLEGSVRVSVIATGIEADSIAAPRPQLISVAGMRVEAGGSARPGLGADGGTPAGARSAIPASGGGHETAEGSAESAGTQLPADDLLARVHPDGGAEEETGAAPASAETDAFIAPPPMTAESSEQGGETAPRHEKSDVPRVKRDGAEHGGGEKPRRRFKLLDRLTGTGRASPAPAEPATDTSIEPRIAAKTEPVAAADPTPAPAPVPAPKVAPEPVTAQTRLAGLDSADSQLTAGDDEDLLDIPAFLRRQAN